MGSAALLRDHMARGDLWLNHLKGLAFVAFLSAAATLYASHATYRHLPRD